MQPKALPLSVAALIMATCLAGSDAMASAWPEIDYNPAPLDDDVVLPMPCDGAMVFRRVITGEADSPFADLRVQLGWGGADESAYIDFIRTAYVAGGLIEGGERFYLIAKYELTEMQYQVLTSEECPPYDEASAGLAKGGMDWFEAVDLTRSYSQWLLREHRETLPKTSGGPPFVRLPTEAEWEFAARGGLTVSDDERRERIFPVEGGIGDYAWFSGAGSADGRIQYIGGKLPNPLGLHDALGNVEEIILEPFTLNRVWRSHGQPGGFTVKGGSIATPRSEMRTALRQEYPYFQENTGALVSRDIFGTRFAVSTTATGDFDHASTLQQSWKGLATTRVQVDEDPVEALRTLIAEAEEGPLRQQLTVIAAAVSAELAERDEVERQALDNLLIAGGVLAHRLRSLAANISNIRQAITALGDNVPDQARATLERSEAEFRRFAPIYASTMHRVLDDFSRWDLIEISREVENSMIRRGEGALGEDVARFAGQTADLQRDPSWSRSDILADLFVDMLGEWEWIYD